MSARNVEVSREDAVRTARLLDGLADILTDEGPARGLAAAGRIRSRTGDGRLGTTALSAPSRRLLRRAGRPGSCPSVWTGR